MWTDYSPGDKAFRQVCPRIKHTLYRALQVAERVQASTCALPAVSGGIFTHWSVTDKTIKEREQYAARQAAVEAVLTWALKRSKRRGASTGKGTEKEGSLRAIYLCDLPRKKLGSIHLFVRAWDLVIKTRAKSAGVAALAPLPLPTSSASPTPGTDSLSPEEEEAGTDHHD